MEQFDIGMTQPWPAWDIDPAPCRRRFRAATAQWLWP
jgi:hypothetical protein